MAKLWHNKRVGRQCQWCLRDDSRAYFTSRTCCARCGTARYKYGECECGHPLALETYAERVDQSKCSGCRSFWASTALARVGGGRIQVLLVCVDGRKRLDIVHGNSQLRVDGKVTTYKRLAKYTVGSAMLRLTLSVENFDRNRTSRPLVATGSGWGKLSSNLVEKFYDLFSHPDVQLYGFLTYQYTRSVMWPTVENELSSRRNWERFKARLASLKIKFEAVRPEDDSGVWPIKLNEDVPAIHRTLGYLMQAWEKL